jgi:hypothetical protein
VQIYTIFSNSRVFQIKTSNKYKMSKKKKSHKHKSLKKNKKKNDKKHRSPSSTSASSSDDSASTTVSRSPSPERAKIEKVLATTVETTKRNWFLSQKSESLLVSTLTYLCIRTTCPSIQLNNNNNDIYLSSSKKTRSKSRQQHLFG